MTKEQEFRKQTEEAKFEAFSLMCKKVAELEKENAELENDYKLIDKSREHLVQEKYNLEYKIENLENKIEHHQEVINTLQKKNAELSEKLNRHKHDCPNCSAFGKHCPHRVNGDPYTYDCYLTVAELEKENAELKCECRRCVYTDCPCVLSDYGKDKNGICDHFKDVFDENAELKELIEKYRQAVDKCLHITFMGCGCEVNTIGQYATLVDGYLTDVEGLAKWKK